jgi:hypothetical protein
MMRRREFLIGCGCSVTAPAFAAFGWPPATGPLPVALPVAAPAQAQGTTLEALVLRIDGWELPESRGSSADNQMWVSVNSSWRAAWR